MRVLTLVSLVVLVAVVSCSRENSADYHFDKIHEYQEFITDPKNTRPNGKYSVTSVTSVPFDVDYHFRKLAEMGEIIERDFEFPTVMRNSETSQQWMKLCRDHSNILNGTGDASGPEGETPLSFTLWYHSEAQTAIDEFVARLKEEVSESESIIQNSIEDSVVN